MLAIIQARMRSSRFPGKALADLCGHPMLWHVAERARQASRIDQIIVATTDQPADDAIVDFCADARLACFRGSEEDVLDRFYQAAKKWNARSVVRITADCPLIDPRVIDRVIARFSDGSWDYVSNTLRYTYPDGLDTEVFSFSALERTWRDATKASDREHVTPFMKQQQFAACNVESEKPIPPEAPVRWTVDYPSDLEFVRQVYSRLSVDSGFEAVLKMLDKEANIKAHATIKISNEGYYRSLFREAASGAAPALQLMESRVWLERSLKVIPSATQTFSKKHTQYVQGVAPVFLRSGKGCRATDVDGNTYIDYVQGLLPNILGYAHPDVNAAVTDQLSRGHSFSLPHIIEVQLAERLSKIIPCAEMVRFGKNGSDATAGSVRLARAITGRERIACCGYHGWQDWYIGSTTRNAGVPDCVRSLTHTFQYNDPASLENLLREHPGEFAAVIMEPFNFEEPKADFLSSVRDMAKQNGALLIFDEICTGFHFGLGGAQKLFGVTPDLACFGKAMANGFPISCVVGHRDVMRSFDDIFFSFTFAGEAASIAAAIRVLDILESTDALSRIEASGKVLQDGLNVMIEEAGLQSRIRCLGRPQWSLLKFSNGQNGEDVVLKNLFQQEIVKRGVLVNSTHNMTAAHDVAAVQETLEVYAQVLKTLARWTEDRSPARFLEGEMSQPVFRVR